VFRGWAVPPLCWRRSRFAGARRAKATAAVRRSYRREHPGAVTVRITGGSAAQRSELRRILAGMGNTLITSAHIDISGDDGRKRVGLGFGAWRTEDRRALWEEMLVAAVFHKRSNCGGLPRAEYPRGSPNGAQLG
jgi:hypothetical protein